MIDAILDLPSHLRHRLASALDAGLVAAPYSDSSLRSLLGNAAGVDHIVAALSELGRVGISGPAAAAWIENVEQAAARIPRADLVWSGLEVPWLHARDTRRVYEELLDGAEHSAWVSTYAFFDGPRAFEVLARRMWTPDPGLVLLCCLTSSVRGAIPEPRSSWSDGSLIASGKSSGRARRVRTSIMTRARRTRMVRAGFSMPRRSWPTTRRCP